MDTYIFYSKGRKRKKIKANDHIEACEKFYEATPDFNLKELETIEVVDNKKHKRKEWADMHSKRKRTEDDSKGS